MSKLEKEEAGKQIEELQRKIDELETAKREQQDWIERLLEYMDLSEDEMKSTYDKYRNNVL